MALKPSVTTTQTSSLASAIALTCAATTLPGSAIAQARSFELPPIILKAMDGSDTITESAASRQTITAEQIKQQGARTLGDALVMADGVFLRTGGDGTRRVDIRGLRTRQVLLLVNGVPVRSSVDGQFDPDRFMVEGISQIEITRGASSVLFGTGASAGVINIVTDAPTGLTASAGVEGGTGGAYSSFFSVGNGNSDGHIHFSGGWKGRDNFPLSDDFKGAANQPTGKRLNSDRKESSFLADGSYRIDEQTTLGFSAFRSSGEYGKPPQIYDRNTDPYANRARFERVEDFTTESLQLLSAREFDGWELRPRLYVTRDRELTKGYDNANYDSQAKNRAFTEDAESLIWGAQVLAPIHLSDAGRLTFMAKYEHQEWNANGFEMVSGGGGSGGGGGGGGGGSGSVKRTPIDISAETETITGAVEYETDVTDRLAIVAGGGYAMQRGDGADGEDYFYRLAGTYDLSDDTRLTFQHAREIRFPTLRDLFAVDRGNPDLDAERTKHWEVGLIHDTDFWNTELSATLFRIKANNYIDRGMSGFAENIESLRMQGIELAANMHPTSAFDLRVGYTLLDSKNESHDALTSDLQNRPRHKITLGSTYRFGEGTQLDLQYMAALDSRTLNKDKNKSKSVGDFHLVDIGLTQELPQTGAEVYLRVRNLFDENYQGSYGYAQSGRSFTVGGRITF